MKKRLSAGQRRLLEFLRPFKTGDEITMKQLRVATKWKPGTIGPYFRKHYFDPFLSDQGGGKFAVRRDGDTIEEQDIAEAFTQVKPAEAVFDHGTVIHGVLDEYELDAKQGAGAVAQVWRAKARKSGDLIAAKIVLPRPDLLEPTNFENVRERFRRETKVGRSLRGLAKITLTF